MLLDLLGLKLLVEMAEPENATVVKVRWTMLQDNKTMHVTADTMVQVWYAVVTADTEILQWMKQKFKLSDIRTVQPSTYEIRLENLLPDTEYYLKVVKPPREDGDSESGTSSNTVKVKTFTAGMPFSLIVRLLAVS